MFTATLPRLLHQSLRQSTVRLRPFHTNAVIRNDRPTVFTNILAGDTPPPVQVSSVTPDGIQLADGLVIPSACIFLEGKVFLWDVPSTLWTGWSQEHFEIFEVVAPKPGIRNFAMLGDDSGLSVLAQRSSCLGLERE
jgi:NADH dehydrogenase [ubiquinone] 1 alpha subcomplex assembly factor 3